MGKRLCDGKEGEEDTSRYWSNHSIIFKNMLLPVIPFIGILITPSMISIYLSCPRKAWYQYVARIPLPPSRAMLIGRIFHETLSQLTHYRRDEDLHAFLIDALTQTIRQHHDLLHEYDLHEHDLHERLTPWLSHAERILQHHLPRAERIMTEVTLTDDQLGLKGRIDLIIRQAERLLLIEWKTGRLKQGFMSPHTLQADAYVHLTRTLADERELFLVSVSTKQHLAWRESPFTPIRLEKTISRVKSIFQQEEPPEPVRTPACRYCPYFSRCWGMQPSS